MNGIRTKRKSRSKGCKKDDVDNIYRTDYLSFLTQCWVLSGAWQKMGQIESSKQMTRPKQLLFMKWRIQYHKYFLNSYFWVIMSADMVKVISNILIIKF